MGIETIEIKNMEIWNLGILTSYFGKVSFGKVNFARPKKKQRCSSSFFFFGSLFIFRKKHLDAPSVIFGSQWGPQLETKISKNGGWEGTL